MNKSIAQKNMFTPVLTLIFFILNLAGILNHALWRDEAQAWLLARDSHSIPNLLFNMRYEGHPPLWHFLLFFITRWTHDPQAMQLLHLLIATASLWVFVRYSPFTQIQKTLFAFGYFPFYEYAINSRCYALGLLFLFITCAAFKQPLKRYVPLFGCLFLASISNFPAAVISFALGIFLLSDPLKPNPYLKKHIGKIDAVAGAGLFIATSLLIAFLAVLPPETYHAWDPEYHTILDPSRLVTTLSYINDSYFLTSIGSPLVTLSTQQGAILSILETLFFSLIFLPKPRVLFFYLLATGGLLMLFYIKYAYLWHLGHFFLILIISLWLNKLLPSKKYKSFIPQELSLVTRKICPIILFLILSLHGWQGYQAYLTNFTQPFSLSRNVAYFIKDARLDSGIIIGYQDYAVSAVAAYLNQPFYSPETQKFITFCSWNRERTTRPVTLSIVINDAKRLALQHKKDIVLILSDAISSRSIPPGIHLCKNFTDSLNENYSIYTLSFKDAGQLPDQK